MVFAPRSRLTLAGPAAMEPWFGLSQSAMRPWCRGRRKLTLLTPPPGGSESWTGRRIRCATQRTWPGFSPRKCWLSAETESQIPHSLQGLAPTLPRMSKNESSASKAGTPPSPSPTPAGTEARWPTDCRRSLSTGRRHQVWGCGEPLRGASTSPRGQVR